MRKVFYVLPGMIWLLPEGGCSLFREVKVSRQDSLHTEQSRHSLDWKVDSLNSVSRTFSFTDSSGAVFDVEIVPSGAFTFSALGGFSGSASLIRLRGKSQNSSRSVESSTEDTHLKSSGSLKQQMKIKTETSHKEKAKSGNESWWWLLAFFSAGLLVFVATRRSFSY